MLALAVHRAHEGRDRKRIVGKIDDLLDVGAEALLLLRHVAVCLEPRRFFGRSALDPCAVARLVFPDLFGFVRVEAIERVDRASAEIELRVHRLQLRAGVSAVRGTVPALQLVAEHQKVCQRMQLRPERRFALFVGFVERDRELIEAVVQHDRGQRVDVRLGQRLRPALLDQFLIQTRRGEIGMVHEVSEPVGIGRLGADRVVKIFLGDLIRFAEPLCDAEGKQLLDRAERTVKQVFKVRGCRLIHMGKAVEIVIGKEQRAIAAPLAVDLEICHDLLERDLERVADVVEQRGQPPELEEEHRRLVPVPVRLKAVELLERAAEPLVGLVDRKTERKDVHRMRIVIPVLHQKRACVGFEFREQLDHLARPSVLAHEHLEVAIVYRIRVLGDAGVDEVLQLAFETEPVDVHLHVVRDLVRTDARAEIPPRRRLLAFLLLREPQPFATIVQKAQRGGFQVVSHLTRAVEGRFDRSDVRAEAMTVDVSHLLQCGICHVFLPVPFRNRKRL